MDKFINERVRHYRTLKGYSQAAFARKLDMKKNAYSRMEREGSINCEIAKRMADILDIDVRLLMYEENEISQQGTIDALLNEIRASNMVVLLKGHNETKLIELFQGCSEKKQKVILEFVNSICKSELID